MERDKGFIEKTAGISKKIDLAQIAVGFLLASTPIVALGVIGYFAGDYIEDRAKRRS